MLQNGQVGPFGLDDNTNPPLGALGGGGSIRVLSSTLVAQGCVFEDNLAIDSTDQCWAGPWVSDHQGYVWYFNDDDPRTRGNYTNARCDAGMDALASEKLRMSGMHFNGGGAISASTLVAGASLSQVQITACKFQNNGARYRGGAIATLYTHVILVSSTLEQTQNLIYHYLIILLDKLNTISMYQTTTSEGNVCIPSIKLDRVPHTANDIICL